MSLLRWLYIFIILYFHFDVSYVLLLFWFYILYSYLFYIHTLLFRLVFSIYDDHICIWRNINQSWIAKTVVIKITYWLKYIFLVYKHAWYSFYVSEHISTIDSYKHWTVLWFTFFIKWLKRKNRTVTALYASKSFQLIKILE